MLTDWFTIIVQAINFLILVVLLSKFLFTPIIRAMDKREADIADTLNRAREKEHWAEKTKEELARKHLAVAEEREIVLAKAREQAETLEKELSLQAREKVDLARQQWEQDLRQHQDSFLDKAAGAVSDQVMRSTEGVLRELSGRDLGQAVLDRFLERLQSEDRASLLPVTSDEALVLHTTFPLDDQTRDRVRAALHPLFPTAGTIDFKTSGQGAVGIQLTCGSHKITWSIEDHLKTVRNELNGLLTMDKQPS